MDGAFVVIKLRNSLSRPPKAADIKAFSDNLIRNPALSAKSLLRIYFYDGVPSDAVLSNPIDGTKRDLGATDIARNTKSLHQSLETTDDYALRLGEARVQGWTIKDSALKQLYRSPRSLTPTDLKPNVSQKGVDLRIGLDIARLSLRDIVDTIVVVTGDSDMIPAFKFARRAGKRILLSTMGHSVRRELKVHADLVLD